MIVDTIKLADVFDVNVHTVYKWLREGCPVHQQGIRGKQPHLFQTSDVASWKEKKLLDGINNNTDKIGFDEAKRRKAVAEAGIAEIALAKGRGEVAELDVIKKVVENAFATVASRLRKVPERVVMQVVGETDEILIKRAILDEIDQALEALSLVDTEEEFIDE